MEHRLEHGEAGERTEDTQILMPKPTYWPMVFAFGLSLLTAGLVTHYVVSLVGFAIAIRAGIGWWSEVIPHEAHEEMPINVALRPAPILVESRSVVRLKTGEGRHRVRIPERVHPYSAGIWGGLAGGTAMAALACLYGLIAQGSIWYPVNLLAGVVIPGLGQASTQQLRAFNGLAFTAAFIGHGIISILVGLVYAVILPMFPRYAPFWAGVLMPLFWSGFVGTVLNLVNPAMNERISWPWFVACQLAFGLVGGFVIARSANIQTMQSWSFAERASLEAPGVHGHGEGHE